MKKMKRQEIPFSVDNIEKNLNDIAGVRVICSFPDDIYTLADYLEKQDDIKLIKKKITSAIRSRMATAAFI